MSLCCVAYAANLKISFGLCLRKLTLAITPITQGDTQLIMSVGGEIQNFCYAPRGREEGGGGVTLSRRRRRRTRPSSS